MGKQEELILAAQTGNLVQIDKILGQRAKKSGPLQRYVYNLGLRLFIVQIGGRQSLFHCLPLVYLYDPTLLVKLI